MFRPCIQTAFSLYIAFRVRTIASALQYVVACLAFVLPIDASTYQTTNLTVEGDKLCPHHPR